MVNEGKFMATIRDTTQEPSVGLPNNVKNIETG